MCAVQSEQTATNDSGQCAILFRSSLVTHTAIKGATDGVSAHQKKVLRTENVSLTFTQKDRSGITHLCNVSY